jgi:alanine-glyoxylate transaminase/serine-glyoxylate transaminase/serine-pyruvate transaminase
MIHSPDFLPASAPTRVLLGPGPGMPHPRVLRAMATPTVGHLDPVLLQTYAEEQELLRFAFQTRNPWTFAVSGTGTAGMEAALANLIEPGDAMLACVHGYFGARLAEMGSRLGATVDRVERPLGEVFSVDEIAERLSGKMYKIVTLVHAETSTGVEQPQIPAISAAAHAAGALLILDTVTSLGGISVLIDEWEVDVAYSASQKNLGAPSGLAPVTVGPRAQRTIEKRTHPVSSFYLDLGQYANYWNKPHAYHHTAASCLHFALHEGLRIIAEEGLQASFTRQRNNATQLWTGLEEIGVKPFIEPAYRLPALTTASVPSGVDPQAVRGGLLEQYNIEIAGGFGELKDKVWRIGMMGYSSRPENVVLLLGALRQLFANYS